MVVEWNLLQLLCRGTCLFGLCRLLTLAHFVYLPVASVLELLVASLTVGMFENGGMVLAYLLTGLSF